MNLVKIKETRKVTWRQCQPSMLQCFKNKVMRVGSTFCDPFISKILHNKPSSQIVSILQCFPELCASSNLAKKIYIFEGLKFVYSEKATKFCKISTLLLSSMHTDKSKLEISQNFLAFSEYMNFT